MSGLTESQWGRLRAYCRTLTYAEATADTDLARRLGAVLAGREPTMLGRRLDSPIVRECLRWTIGAPAELPRRPHPETVSSRPTEEQPCLRD